MRSMFYSRQGDVRAAVEEVHRALELVPDSPDLLAESAELLLNWTGRVDEAEQLARRALELEDDHEGATRFLAEVAAARALGPDQDDASRDEAIRLFEKLAAASDTTGRPAVLQTLVQLRMQAGDLEGAVRTVRELVQERPGDLRATQTLAQLLLRSGEEMQALEVLLDYGVDHPSREELLGWAEQLASSQQAWPAVVDYLAARAPFARSAPLLNRFYGEALLRVGREEEAAAVLEQALAGRPHDLRLRKDLALAYRAMGRLGEAAALFAELARESPEYPYLQQLLAETLADQGDVDGALHAYRAALRGLDREDVAVSHRDAIRHRIALLHLSRDQGSEARSALDALELPGGAMELEIRCRLAIQTEAWDEARKLAERLAEADPERAGWATLLEGEVAVKEKKWSRARARFEEAVEQLGPYYRVHVAEIYREADRPEDGLPLLEEWIEQDPELADAYFHLGVYFYELDRLDESEGALGEAIRLDPRHARALNFLGYSWVERKIRLDEALGMIERALEVDTWNGAYLDSLGWVYYQMGRYEEAREPLERAARELPTDATVLEHLGDLYNSLGDPANAVTAWNRALEAGPDDREGLLVKIQHAVESTERLDAEDARASREPPSR
jgi:tetratricopeptide (TPR) repeat protein